MKTCRWRYLVSQEGTDATCYFEQSLLPMAEIQYSPIRSSFDVHIRSMSSKVIVVWNKTLFPAIDIDSIRGDCLRCSSLGWINTNADSKHHPGATYCFLLTWRHVEIASRKKAEGKKL